MRFARLSAGILLVVTVGVGGCSPAVYKDEIGEFAKAMTKTRTAYEQLRTEEQDAAVETDARGVLAGGGEFRTLDSCTIGKPDSCGIVIVIDDSSRAYPREKAGPDIAKLLKLMTEYADGLAKIAGAKEADAVNEAAAGVSAAIKRLVEAVASKSGSDVSAQVGFLESGFKWLVGVYVDEKRYNALKSAVTTADPAFKDAGIALGKVIPLLVRSVISSKTARLQHGVQALDEAGNMSCEERLALAKALDEAGNMSCEERLALAKALADESRTLRAFAAQNLTTVVDKMVKAHGELAKALEEGKGSTEAVFKWIREFADQVDALLKAGQGVVGVVIR